MTLEEINALTLDDVKSQVQSRLWGQKDPLPERPDPLPEDFDEQVWYDSQFTQEELDTEFLILKQELLDVENERLRQQDIQDRFEALTDMRASFHSVYPSIPNPSVWLRDLKVQADHADAEAKIAELETKDVELKAVRDSTEYIELRKSEYPSTEELIVAMWEGDQTKIDEIEASRQSVKTKYPKP